MDRKQYRKSQVASAAEHEKKFLDDIASLQDKFGTALDIPAGLQHAYELNDGTVIARGLAKVVLNDGSEANPVILLPDFVDPRLLWYPALTYLFDNAYEERYHTVDPRVLVGGQVAQIVATPYAIPADIIALAKDRLGVAATNPTPLEVSCGGVYGYGVPPNAVFADWGECCGSNVDAGSGREPLSPNRLRDSRLFLDSATVVLVASEPV